MTETLISINVPMNYEFSRHKYIASPYNDDVGDYTIRLSTSAIEQSGSVVSGVEEVSGGTGYVAISIPRNSTYWTQSEEGYLTNTAPIEFQRATASWGNVAAVYITNINGGIVYFANLAPAIEAREGTVITIEGGDMIFGRKDRLVG